MIVKQSITLEVYKKPNGKCPFIEWLAGLQDKKARHRIQARSDRISLGNFGDCESIGQGAFELRFFFGP